MLKRLSRNADSIYVSADTLAGLLDCGKNSAMRVGRESGARVQFGGCVRYDVSKVKDYLNSLTGDGSAA